MGRADIGTWGPCGWNFLHAMSFAYPVTPTLTERLEMFTFLHSFAKVLPCMRCRTHFTKLLNVHLHTPSCDKLDSRESLAVFLVDAHNMVNKRLGKRQLSLDAALSLYDSPDLHAPVPRLRGQQVRSTSERAPLLLYGLCGAVVVMLLLRCAWRRRGRA